MELYLGSNNVLCIDDGITNNNKPIDLWIGNLRFFSLEQILTIYKNDFIVKLTNEIGDKMSILQFFERSPYLFNEFDVFSCICGLSIYQEFDENTSTLDTYLYKYPKSQIEDLNSIFEELQIPVTSQLKDKFVILNGSLPTLNEIENNLNIWMEGKNFKNIFSFLFGVCLVYGNIDMIEDTLNSAKVHIPINGQILLKREILDKLFEYLNNNGVYVNFDIIQKDIGFVYQISILDWELLISFANFISKIQEVESVTYKKILDNYILKLDEYLSENNIISKINYKSGVLKVITK